MSIQELKYDVRRGADTYSAVYHPRLKAWILKGIINREEALVWRSGLSGWRKPEDLDELKPYFEKREEERTRRPQAEHAIPLFPRKKIKRILIIDDEEDYETLGDTLALPPRFRSHRVEIERLIRPIDTTRSDKPIKKEYFG